MQVNFFHIFYQKQGNIECMILIFNVFFFIVENQSNHSKTDFLWNSENYPKSLLALLIMLVRDMKKKSRSIFDQCSAVKEELI